MYMYISYAHTYTHTHTHTHTYKNTHIYTHTLQFGITSTRLTEAFATEENYVLYSEDITTVQEKVSHMTVTHLSCEV